MQWAIYADLSRGLSMEERLAIAEALDKLVPDSGCVGPNRAGVEEVYFCVEASTEAEARAEAHRYVDAVLRDADVKAEYGIYQQPNPRT
ncbi:hypothetical protein ACLESD_06960 [Pyxidicoccus sp. 3LFB2]